MLELLNTAILSSLYIPSMLNLNHVMLHIICTTRLPHKFQTVVVIGLSTTASYLGWVECIAPETKDCADAPSGFIELGMKRSQKMNYILPYLENANVTTPSFGEMTGDFNLISILSLRIRR